MPWWFVVVVLIVFLASRPMAARLWRAGRLSDRTTTILVLGRMPALVLVVCVAQGAAPLLTAGLIAASLLPMAPFFRFAMNLLAEERAERQKEATTAARP